MEKKRVLIFPCGSEIGLEIFRSMRYSTHFQLVGASSVKDHGRFVFDEYIENIPFHNEEAFAEVIKKLVIDYKIDAIYPAMDAVAESLKKIEEYLQIVVIGSSKDTTNICASKSETYRYLVNLIPLPEIYSDFNSISDYPVFIKPDRGYGSRNTYLADSAESAEIFLSKHKSNRMLLLEHLPGEEWTIDCFSNKEGELLFNGSRIRGRISNGISVYTEECHKFSDVFANWAETINSTLRPRGAWFFQAKLDRYGSPKLLEVAARLGGSSALFRCAGINFALLSAYDAFGRDVKVSRNSYQIEMDRALDNRYRLNISYDHVFVDLDDCLIVNGKLNLVLISFLHKSIDEKKKVTLITRHYRDPLITLKEYRISELFDRICHIEDKEIKKSQFIDVANSIFIDDSYYERNDVADCHSIAVFSPDMIEALL